MKTSFLLALLLMVVFVSCDKKNLTPFVKKEEVVDIKLLNDLCLDVENELTPVKDFEFTNKSGFIRFDTHNKFYYLQVAGYEEIKLYSCKLTDEFKHEGTKIIVSGASYITRCKPLHPCGGMATLPFLIVNIKSL